MSSTQLKQVLNAADHGMPQLRERAFLIASRDGETFQLPAPSLADPAAGRELDLCPLPPGHTTLRVFVTLAVGWYAPG